MKPIEIKNCEDEPITIPGSIQNHGLFFAVHSNTYAIEQTSENIKKILGFPASDLLSKDVRDLILPKHRTHFETLLTEAADNYVNPFQVEVTRANGESLRCDGIAHAIGQDITLLELEPIALESARTESLENYFQLVQNSLQLSADLSAIPDIANLMAEKVKSFTGFDRVMVYRFDLDHSGEVIAEACEDEMEPYLHLRYPASDVPAQARALYLKNWVRLLCDVDAEISPLQPVEHPRLGAPTPLDKSVLRSMSPIHLQYLRNMGVQATLTISLVVDGKLWGLIACHHRTPRFVSYGIRSTASLYGVVMSSQLSRAENSQKELERLSREKAVSVLLSKLDQQDELEATFAKSLPALADIFQADGVAFLSSGKPLTHGSCPPVSALNRMAAQLSEGGPEEIIITEQTAAALPELADLLPKAAGLIAFSLGQDSWLTILRDESTEKVRWSGNPNAAKKRDALGRLTPRESFREWIEEVRGRSIPWPEYTPLLIDELRSGLVGFVMSRNRALESSNEDLRNFASVIAHEVKSQIQPPLLALSIMQEQASGEKLASMLELGVNSLSTLSEFTSEMLSFAHMDIDTTDLEEVDFGEVARHASAQAIAGLAETTIHTTIHPLPKRQASLSQSHHLFLNLIRNAIIHGPLDGQDDFFVEIGERQVEGEPCFYIRDNGRGIPPEDQSKIFNYFHRGKGSIKRKGSGIGLGFARRLLEKTGGRIWVESEVNQGCTFFFTLGNEKAALPKEDG